MARIGTRIEVTEESTQQRSFENLPDGTYRLEISASTAKEEDNPRKFNLNATIDVVEPDALKGRKLFTNYNLEHPNATAQEIGQRQFSCLLRALGLSEAPEDSEELHFITFVADIGMGKPSKDGKYEARNEIKKYYYPDEGNEPPIGMKVANDNAPAPRAAANDNRAAPAAAPAKPAGARPWGQKKAA